jgi:hypothetical protein
MNRDIDKVSSWVNGELDVPALSFVVSGDTTNMPATFEVYACLYPKLPFFRILSLPGVSFDRRDIKRQIAACKLPPEANRAYERYCRRAGLPGLLSDVMWLDACAEASDVGLPLGFYAFGKTVTGAPRGLLWILASAPPTLFLEELKDPGRSL